MKYVITPIECQIGGAWVPDEIRALDGCFYDYLYAGDDLLIGVRYWLDESASFAGNVVFQQFSNDPRFEFSATENYVDIVFDSENVEALQSGNLRVRTVQDLGGEGVITNGDALGIVFEI